MGFSQYREVVETRSDNAAGLRSDKGRGAKTAGALSALALCVCLVAFALSGPASGQVPVLNDSVWITNGVVRAIASSGSVTYIAGDFTAVGPYTGRGAALDGSSAAPNMALPRVNGAISSVVADGAGGWYIGGSFTAVGPVMRNRIAHILPSGGLDTAWNPNANSTVSALAVSGGVVYASGSFTNIGGQTRNYLAALNPATGIATGWNPNANNTVVAIQPSSDASTLFVGGTFTSIGGQTRNRIAALSSATGLATSWNPASGSTVSALRLSSDGSTIYAGGAFTSIGGQARNYIAALSTATGLATGWNPASSAAVSTLALSADNSTVYAGGTFTTIGGQTRNRIAALSASTGLATTWNPNCNSTVSTLAVSADGATVYAGGSFTSAGGQTRYYIAGLSAATGLATAWDANANSAVTALAVQGTTVYAGGSFYSIGRYNRNRIAAIDSASGAATGWNPNAGASVYALAVSHDSNTVYAGGSFTTIGGQTRNRIAALSAATGLATAWNPNSNNTVQSIAVNLDASIIYAGGTFTTIGGQTRNRIAALSGSGTGLATTWNPNSNSTLNAVVLSADQATVYAGGSFTTIGGQTRNRIAALSTAGAGLATAWNPNSSGTISALGLSPDGGTVYAGGSFVSIGGQSRSNIAAIGAASGLATAWDPGASSTVSAIAVNGDAVYIGGSFGAAGGQSRNYIACLDRATGAASDFNPNPNAAVLAVAAGSRIFAGGSFTAVNGDSFTYFAGFRYPAPIVGGIMPPSGIRGETLSGALISGSEFRDVPMTVELRRGAEVIAATNVAWVSTTQVTADIAIPPGATVGDDWAVFLRQDDDGSSATLADAFSVQYPPPSVTGISPSAGDRGQTLTGVEITGGDLRSGSITVQLRKGAETIAGTGVTWVDPTRVTADFTIPANATVGSDWDVFLQQNDDGKSSTLVDGFEVEYPPPSVYSIAPDSGNNEGAVHITNLAGSGFRAGATARLTLAGQPDIVSTGLNVVSGNKITCDFDLNGVATGLWDVTVTNTDGKSDTLAGGFAVQHEGPTVTTVTPSTGINDGVVHIDKIEGTSFRSGALVSLRKPGQPDIGAFNVVVNSPTDIDCDINLAGKAAGDWDVVVRNDDGQWGMLEDGFLIQNPNPLVSGISPSVANQGEVLDDVTISGSDFRDVSMTIQLRRGAQAIAGTGITWVNPTTVTADFNIPSGAAVGSDWDVFLQNNDDSKSSTLSDAFTVEYAPPIVSSIAPSEGDNDGTVGITNLAGTGFRGGATVTLSMPGQPDISATSVDIVSGSRITCDFDLTGAATGAWDVTVTNTDLKSGVLLDGFEVEYPAPVVSGISPSFANNDGTVHISGLTGADFRSGAIVKLHKAGNPDIIATAVVVTSPGQIECDLDLSGRAVGDWSVIVTNDDGKSGTLEDGFDVQYPPPVAGGISPSSGDLGQLLNNVSISGSDFRNTSITVRLLNGPDSIDGTEVHWVSDTELTADFYIPYTATVGAGWDLFVQNNDDGKSSTVTGVFTVEYADPIVSSISPSVGNNDGTVHITGLLGANFRAGATATLSMSGQPDIVANSVTVVSQSKITCEFDLVGAATGTWDVTVTNTDAKSGTLPGAFSVRYPSPTITGITPSAADNDAAVHITALAGTDFRAGAIVKLHKSGHPDIDATGVAVVSDDLITCDFDLTGKSVGNWNVIVTNDDGKSATLEEGFRIEYPPPALTGMAPDTGPAQTTLRNVLIEGSDFRNTAARIELFNGADTIFGTNIRWVSSTQVLCDLPLDGAPEGPGWSLYYAHLDDGKSAILPDAFTVGPPPPQRPFVASISPSEGIPGYEVTIEGVNFGADQDTSVVTFNGVPAADYLLWSEERIEVVVPGAASTGPVVVSTAGGSSNGDRRYTITTPSWYLAEGSTAWGFSTYLTVMNPNDAELHARLTYMLSGGGVVNQEVDLPALSQVTVNPETVLGAADFSTSINCLEGETISVDRTMSWTGQGASSDEGHCSVGTTLPSKTWYLPEGCSAYGFETWLLIQNPNTSAAQVEVTYMIEGVGPRSFSRTVLPRSRTTYNIADDIGAYSASISVSSSDPVIAERATYRNNRREGHESIGATFASKTFYLPEGTTGWGYTTYVLVQNPNNAAAQVTLTYMTASGPVQQDPFTMAPKTRATVDVNSQLSSMDFSTKVSATQPVVAERAMYWTTASGSVCHCSIGLAQPHSSYYLPDGQTSQGRETFTLVQNPNPSSVDVEVIYYGANGSFDILVRKTLAANSRATFNMSDRLPSGRAAILVRSATPGAKILAERSMYWNGRSAGTCTVGGYSD